MRWRVVTLPRLDETTYDLELHCDTEDQTVITAIETAAANAGMWIERITPTEDWGKMPEPTTDERTP